MNVVSKTAAYTLYTLLSSTSWEADGTSGAHINKCDRWLQLIWLGSNFEDVGVEKMLLGERGANLGCLSTDPKLIFSVCV